MIFWRSTSESLILKALATMDTLSPHEQAAKEHERKQEQQRALAERKDKFPEISEVLELSDAAEKKLENLLAEINSLPTSINLQTTDLAEKRKEFAGNLLPGMKSFKQVSVLLGRAMLGSYYASTPPYIPPTLESLQRAASFVKESKARAKELNKGDELRDAQIALVKLNADLATQVLELDDDAQADYFRIQDKVENLT